MMKNKQRRSNLLFKREWRNKYHIRKYSVGIASVMFGSLCYLSMDQQAQAAETNTTTPVTDTANQSSSTSDPNPAPSTTNNPSSTPNTDTPQSPSTSAQNATADTTTDPAPATDNTVAQTASTQTASTQTNNEPQKVNVEGINEQVYSKKVEVYPQSEVAKTAKMQRGIYQAREDLGIIVPANKQFYIRQAPGSNESDLHVDLMTNDKQKVKSATVSQDGSWTHLSTDIDSAPFVHIPTGLTNQPVVEYYVENNEAQTLPTYRKGGDKQAFDAAWQQSNASYGYVDGDKIAFLIPNVDRQRIADLGQNPGPNGFKDLDDMIHFYEDIINHYDTWVGLNDDINSVNYNVGQKYFTIADAHGPGLAYYSTSNMGSNSPSMSGYLEKGWLALHEVGHGYDGAMTYDPKMDLIEVENNILANQYQTTVMGEQNGWLYEGQQAQRQKEFTDRLASGDMSYANGGFRGRLDLMTKMVRLTGIEGFTDMWKSIRQEEADAAKASKPFTQDVPRWINTYWLADNGLNGTAYFDLYKINIPQTLRNDIDAYQNHYMYPLSLLISDTDEQNRIVEKLGLATPYELVKSSDLADTALREQADVVLNLNGQTLPDHVKVGLMEGPDEVANAEVVNGKATFSNIRPGIYKIVAPLTESYALPNSQYLIVKDNGENETVVDYPAYDNVQKNVSQTISLRGLGNNEIAALDYQPAKKQVTLKQSAVQPHVYFSTEYAHVTIQKADGTQVFDQSYIGNKKYPNASQTFDLEFGDKIIVKHAEPAARRVVTRNETGETVDLPKRDDETITYILTDKGLIVEGETQADANQRYDQAIASDVNQIAALIASHPERDERLSLFEVNQGIQFVDDSVKQALINQMAPLIQPYIVSTPVVQHIEAGATSINGTGTPESTISIVLPNKEEVLTVVDENGNWNVSLPEGVSLKHNDVTLIKATGKYGTVSSDVNIVVKDTIAPEVPVIAPVEAGSHIVSGTSDPNTTVIVTLPNGTTQSVQADETGAWSVDFSFNLVDGTELTAVAEDEAGNQSQSTMETVHDTTPPSVPTVNEVKETDKTIQGTSDSNTTVVVQLTDYNPIDTVATEYGEWAIDIPEDYQLQDDSVISIYAEDEAGNQSPDNEVIVEKVEKPQETTDTNETKAPTPTTEVPATTNEEIDSNTTNKDNKEEPQNTTDTDETKAPTPTTEVPATTNEEVDSNTTNKDNKEEPQKTTEVKPMPSSETSTGQATKEKNGSNKASEANVVHEQETKPTKPITITTPEASAVKEIKTEKADEHVQATKGHVPTVQKDSIVTRTNIQVNSTEKEALTTTNEPKEIKHSEVLPNTGQNQSNSPLGWIASLFGIALISRIWNKKEKEEK